MWIAKVDSPSFSFEAYGRTAQEAADALSAGLQRHATARGAAAGWLADAIADIQTLPIEPGRCYRDGTEI